MIDRWLVVHSLRCPPRLYRNNTAADASYPVVRRPLGLRRTVGGEGGGVVDQTNHFSAWRDAELSRL